MQLPDLDLYRATSGHLRELDGQNELVGVPAKRDGRTTGHVGTCPIACARSHTDILTVT